jgi:hypothetical protein
MFPGFTAEAATGAAARGARYWTKRTAAAEPTALLPQQRAVRVEGVDPGSGGADPATTCTCPCCQTVRGRLICC